MTDCLIRPVSPDYTFADLDGVCGHSAQHGSHTASTGPESRGGQASQSAQSYIIWVLCTLT